MFYLVASCISLLVCPLFYRYLSSDNGLRKGLDAFVFITLSGLVVLHILPDIMRVGGITAIGLGIAGLVVPTLAERLCKKGSKTTLKLTVFLSVLGLLLHNITDGCSIMLAQQADASVMLAVGVILHRLPEGLAIWWLVQPKMGSTLASGVIVLMMIMTGIGYFAGGELLIHLNLESTVYLQAFVVGSIMHVLLHQHNEDACDHKELPARLGGLIGFAVLYMLVSGTGHVHHHEHTASASVEAVSK